MKLLLESIENLKNTEIKELIDSRLRDFKKVEDVFSELCFCLLTANFNAEKSIKIQKEIGNGFLTLSEKELSEKLKQLNHRFPNARARYIVEARQHKTKLNEIINSLNENELREWLVKNVKGLRYKEASHFLRNIGYKNLAIIDFHIIDLLVKYKLIDKLKTLTKKKYLGIEDLLKQIAEKLNMNLAELDLYLWYMETGKVLK